MDVLSKVKSLISRVGAICTIDGPCKGRGDKRSYYGKVQLGHLYLDSFVSQTPQIFFDFSISYFNVMSGSHNSLATLIRPFGERIKSEWRNGGDKTVEAGLMKYIQNKKKVSRETIAAFK